MEILRREIPPEDRLWIGECNVCGSIAQAPQRELGKINPGDYRSDNEAWTWADCPVCKGKGKMCFHLVKSTSGQRVLAKTLDNSGTT